MASGRSLLILLPPQAEFDALSKEFGELNLRHERYLQEGKETNLPVELHDGTTVSSRAKSETPKNIPVVSVDRAFAEESFYSKANKQLGSWHDDIICPAEEEN